MNTVAKYVNKMMLQHYVACYLHVVCHLHTIFKRQVAKLTAVAYFSAVVLVALSKRDSSSYKAICCFAWQEACQEVVSIEKLEQFLKLTLEVCAAVKFALRILVFF